MKTYEKQIYIDELQLEHFKQLKEGKKKPNRDNFVVKNGGK